MRKFVIGFFILFISSFTFSQSVTLESYTVTVYASYTYQNNQFQEINASFSYTVTRTGSGIDERERKQEAEWSAKNCVERYAKEDLASRSDVDFYSRVKNLQIISVSSYKQ